MKLYKVIKNNQSCHNGSFDWTKFLPRKSGPGKWTPRIRRPEECSLGYHVTPYWNMWLEEGCDVFECETKGLQKKEEVGVVDKYVCESIRLLKKIDLDFDKNRNTGNSNTGNRNTGDCNTGNSNTGDCNTGNRNTGNCNTGNWNTGYRNTGDCNTGDSNTGYRNTGDCNTGYRNTGDRNTGNRNTGNCNTGNWNTGDRNTGNWNTGYRNTGDCNTGDSNTGYRNTGDCNTGYRNTGDCNTGNRNTGNCNTGNWNTGDRNTGNWNTGNWNTGYCNTGAFNTSRPRYYELFNKPVKAEVYQQIDFPAWFYFDLMKGDYKASWLASFKKASANEVQRAIELPNFDYAVFEEITGITKRMITLKISKG